MPVHSTEDYARFVGFAFAAADMVVEIDADGRMLYVAGTFELEFGLPAQTFVGRNLRSLIAAADHETLDAALALLLGQRRLQPVTIRLCNARRRRVALSGLSLPIEGAVPRLCLTLAALPAAVATVAARGAHALARSAEARLRSSTACDLGLIEVQLPGVTGPLRGAVGSALEAAAPHAVTAEVAPGRFGLLGEGGTAADLLKIATLLERSLQAQGLEATVASTHLSITPPQTGPGAVPGLTPLQAARALRQALSLFSRGGLAQVQEAGFGQGLAGYLAQAASRTPALRQAIEKHRFEITFQPIVWLTSREVHHYEALIRPMPVPGCPFSTTQEFVLLVEALGLSGEFDLQVAEQCCRYAARSRAAIAFNLSNQSLQGAVFSDRLLTLMSRDPAVRDGLISVEMTETAEIEDVAQVSAAADALRALGVAFCLDDFGAGAADVRLLHALRPDIVKLDGSYVAGITEDGRERAFLAGMAEIAHAAGARTLAERVEHEQEAHALLSIGVHYGQGWLFGRPGPLVTNGVSAATIKTARRR